MEAPVWTEERKTRARECAQAWAGTRHRNRIAVKGEGIDCIRFVFEVLASAGVCDRFRMPSYDGRLGILRPVNLMEGLIVDHLFGEVRTKETPLEFGDLCIFECGRCSNHLGIFLDGAVWHVPGQGAVGPDAAANVTPKLQSIVRLTACGFRDHPGLLTWDEIKARTA